jgi:hypothetical protein
MMDPHNTVPATQDQQTPPQITPEIRVNGSAPQSRGQGADAEDLRYEPIPPRTTVTISVRYRVRGRGRPLPYPTDAEDGGE